MREREREREREQIEVDWGGEGLGEREDICVCYLPCRRAEFTTVVAGRIVQSQSVLVLVVRVLAAAQPYEL